MVLIRISSGTATMAPIAPHIQPSRAIVANTATVLSAQRRLTKAGVTNCDSAKWIRVRMAGAATIRGQSSKVSRPASATRAITTGGPTKGTNEATPSSTPHIMALGRPSSSSAIVDSTATAR